MKSVQLMFVLAIASLTLISCEWDDRVYSGKMQTSGFSYQDGQATISVASGEHDVEVTGRAEADMATNFAVMKMSKTNQAVRLSLSVTDVPPENGEFQFNGLMGQDKVVVAGQAELSETELERKFVDTECKQGFISKRVATVQQTRTLKTKVLRQQELLMDLDLQSAVTIDKTLETSDCSPTKQRWGDLTPLDQMAKLNRGTYYLTSIVSGRSSSTASSFAVLGSDYEKGFSIKGNDGYLVQLSGCAVTFKNQVRCYNTPLDTLVVIDSNTFIWERNHSSHPVKAIYQRL